MRNTKDMFPKKIASIRGILACKFLIEVMGTVSGLACSFFFSEQWATQHSFQTNLSQDDVLGEYIFICNRTLSLDKEMVIHSSILAWRIPWTEKPGRLQSTGSQRVGHD